MTAALAAVVAEARETGLVFTAPTVDLGPRVAAHVPDGRHWAGHIAAHPDGAFTVLTVDGGMDELPVPATQRDELRALLSMRDLARDLLSGEAASRDDTPELDRLRTRLADTYHGYLQTYGPINRSTITTSATRVDPDTGQPLTTRRTPPVMRILRRDPFGPLVRALESYDEVSGVATPASILSERVVQPRTPILGADTPADALAVSLEAHGRVDLPDIARLRGVTEAEARTELGTLVYRDPAYRDPAGGRWSPRWSTCPGTSGSNSPTPGGPPWRTRTWR